MSTSQTQIELESIPARIVLSESFTGDDDEATLCCPVCGFDCVHIGKVEVLQNKTKAVSTWDRTEVSAHHKQQHNRGSVVRVNFFCESNHKFVYEFAFHKGQTSLNLRAAQLGPNNFDNGGTLWRD